MTEIIDQIEAPRTVELDGHAFVSWPSGVDTRTWETISWRHGCKCGVNYVTVGLPPGVQHEVHIYEMASNLEGRRWVERWKETALGRESGNPS